MTIKKCTCCKRLMTTKNAIKIGRNELAIYFNCRNCDSTVILRAKNWKEIMFKENNSEKTRKAS